MTAAEYLATAGAAVEIVTPERTLAPDIGGTSFPPYFKVFSDHDVRVTLNLRLESVRRDGNRLIGRFHDEYGRRHVEKSADRIVVEHGCLPLDDLYFALKPGSINLGAIDQPAFIAGTPQTLAPNPDGQYRLYRIGDAVASRNIHAGIYEALRLLKDL